MTNIDWDKLIQDEDRLIENSNRKHRNHFKSIEYMSEELVYQESMAKYQIYEPADDTDDFIKLVKNHNLKKALNSLTEKQKKVIELYFWQNLKQHEIAEIMGCTRKNISDHISKALNKIKKHL